MTTHSSDVHKLIYSNLLHMKSHFMALRPTLKDLANNCSQLVATSSPDHWIYCIYACMYAPVDASRGLEKFWIYV